MTIKEYADYQGLTKGAVYNAIRRSGHSMKDLTDAKGNISPAGFAILGEIYPEVKKPSQETGSERPKKSRSKNSASENLRDRLSEAEKALVKAEAELQAQTEKSALFERLYNEKCDELKKQQALFEQEKASLHQRLSEAHGVISQQQESARLAKMNPIKRLFAGRKKKPADAVETHGEVN